MWDRLVPPYSDACPPDSTRRGDSLRARDTSASTADRNASNTDRRLVGMREVPPRPGGSSTPAGGGGGVTRRGIPVWPPPEVVRRRLAPPPRPAGVAKDTSGGAPRPRPPAGGSGMLAPRHSTGHQQAPEGLEPKRTEKKRGTAKERRGASRYGRKVCPYPLMLHHLCSGFLSSVRNGKSVTPGALMWDAQNEPAREKCSPRPSRGEGQRYYGTNPREQETQGTVGLFFGHQGAAETSP